MQLLPAIDILEGKVVRLAKGDYNAVTVYNDSPIDQAKAFEEMGAEWIHVVDLDLSLIHIYRAFHTSNFVALDNLTKTTEGNQAAISALAQLPMLRGQKEALGEIRALLAPLGCSEGIDELEALYDLLVERGLGAVSYTHLDVYKRQLHYSRSVQCI